MNTQTRYALLLLVAIAVLILSTSAGANQIGVCIRNCAQCKKMFGSYFEGQLCADTCVKFKGKIIPDCEDASSIAPFITKLADD
ncbi:eclosion hormone [Cephus cinctus]|uniref:Eclosion hormone n=1 Tax=Cephus cinctus TaxID=211228 RepID=A0AAJ7BMD7_CEPCN|nr:eclosion hormone [Cephus cinctus]XP_015589730.1 eclosion hormone [Cephus cinctus]